MKPEPDEQELAIRARDGDRNALKELIEGARLRLFALAYAELRHYEDAQDVVASALLQICQHAHELRAPDAIRAWMNSIVRNEARRLRHGERAEHTSLDSVAEVGTAERSPLMRIDIERALRQLPNDQARAIALFHFSELPIAEIARQFQRPEGTIKRWLHYGRQRLAQEMKGYGTMAQEWTATLLTDELTEEQIQKITGAFTTA